MIIARTKHNDNVTYVFREIWLQHSGRDSLHPCHGDGESDRRIRSIILSPRSFSYYRRDVRRVPAYTRAQVPFDHRHRQSPRLVTTAAERRDRVLLLRERRRRTVGHVGTAKTYGACEMTFGNRAVLVAETAEKRFIFVLRNTRTDRLSPRCRLEFSFDTKHDAHQPYYVQYAIQYFRNSTRIANILYVIIIIITVIIDSCTGKIAPTDGHCTDIVFGKLLSVGTPTCNSSGETIAS